MKDKVTTGLLAIILIVFAIIAKVKLGSEIDWIVGIILVLAIGVGWFARGAKEK